MGKWIVAAVASLAIVGAARAEQPEPYDGQHWEEPSFALLKAKWARDAGGILIYGDVKLDCGVSPDGFAADCKVLSAEPSDPAMIKAALKLAPFFKAKGKFQRAVVDLDVRFDQEIRYLKEPSTAQTKAVHPPASLDIPGSATISCIAGIDERLHACSVVREDPPMLGFGTAALAISAYFKVKPAQREGKPIDSDVMISQIFNSRFDIQPTLISRPTHEQMTAWYPQAARRRGLSGMAMLFCKVQLDGRLGDCAIASEEPADFGFGRSAVALASFFLFKPATSKRRPIETYISVPIDFDPHF
jgi:TonB family protein